MALLKYGFVIKSRNDPASVVDLPNPSGVLSKAIPSSAIQSANTAVREVLIEREAPNAKRGRYQHYSDKEKAEIAKRAIDHGITDTVRHYASLYPERSEIPVSSVATWKARYLKELKIRVRESQKENQGENQGENMQEVVISELPNKKRGRPLLLGKELDNYVITYINHLRSSGAVVNTAIVMAAGSGMVQYRDSNLLSANGGPISITKAWAKSLLSRMHFVKRCATTKQPKMSSIDFEAGKAQFLYDAKVLIEMEEIPDSLVLNWDQTGIHYVPVSNWTMAKEGSKRVEIVGAEDKRQITAVLCVTKSGHYLPPQIIYAGKTPRCLPKSKFPTDWHITYTDNHWSNQVTTLQYITNVLLPYVTQKKSELGLSSDHRSLVIFDRFKGQCTEAVLKMLEENHIDVLLVPANCTDGLQPLDVSINKAVKDFLRNEFQGWYASQVQIQLQNGSAFPDINLSLSVVKPLGVTWLKNTLDYLKINPHIAINGFRKAGLL